MAGLHVTVEDVFRREYFSIVIALKLKLFDLATFVLQFQVLDD
jgi:hypothetical protein